MPKHPKHKDGQVAPSPEPVTPASRAIDVAFRVLSRTDIRPDRPNPETITGLDTTRRSNQMFFFEIIGTPEGGVLIQMDSAPDLFASELEAVKRRIAEVNTNPICTENGQTVLALRTTRPQLGRFKLAALAHIQPQAGEEVISEERFRQRFLLDAYGLFTRYDIIKALE